MWKWQWHRGDGSGCSMRRYVISSLTNNPNIYYNDRQSRARSFTEKIRMHTYTSSNVEVVCGKPVQNLGFCSKYHDGNIFLK